MKIKEIIFQWIDSDSANIDTTNLDQKFDWFRVLPFVLMHLACLAVFWVGWSWVAVLSAAFLYFIRMFAITGFYHRYFSHRSFKSSRFCQFLFALLGCSAVQRGPLWWAAHHREHHRNSDKPGDLHSPVVRGFWWSHMFWFTCKANFATHYAKIRDFAKFPELVFLNRFDTLVPLLFAAACYAAGALLETWAPQLETSGPQMLVWCFFISTIILAHATFTINSLAHVFGKRRYKTADQSRNNFLLALLTLGEGWHNNHHRFPGSVRQGFYWWEVDITYYILKTMAWLGLIWDLRPVPAKVLDEGASRPDGSKTSHQ